MENNKQEETEEDEILYNNPPLSSLQEILYSTIAFTPVIYTIRALIQDNLYFPPISRRPDSDGIHIHGLPIWIYFFASLIFFSAVMVYIFSRGNEKLDPNHYTFIAYLLYLLAFVVFILAPYIALLF